VSPPIPLSMRGLGELPAGEKYVCADFCNGLKHTYSICHHYGIVNLTKMSFIVKDGCGLFFHESCLAMQNVEVRRTQQQDEVAIVDGVCQ
jgi:hypothetical protein